MKILVTGGAGLIGRHLVQLLVKKEHEVRVLDNFRLSDPTYLSTLSDQIQLIEGDVTDLQKVEEATNSVNIVFHLAAPSSMLMYREAPILSTHTTVEGTLNVLEAMRKYDVPRLIYASTSAVYEGNPVPWVESMQLNPPDLKALSKKFGEEIAKNYSDRYGIECVAARPLSVYGYDEETKQGYANVISLFVWTMLDDRRPAVWGDGNQTRDFIYVDDAAESLFLAMNSKLDQKFEVFNVGTGKETSFNSVVNTINTLLGKSLEPIYVPVQIDIYGYRIVGDPTKAEKMLGFKAKISVEEGVRHVIQNAKEVMKAKGDELSKYQLKFTNLS